MQLFYLLENGYRDIVEVRLVGTYTSNWFDMGLYLQVVIFLLVTVETALVLAYGNESFLGEYDWISDIGKKRILSFCRQNMEVKIKALLIQL